MRSQEAERAATTGGLRREPWLPGALRTVARFVRAKPLGAVGGGLVLLIVILALTAGWIAPYPYDEVHLTDRFDAPSRQFLLGADNLGRDVLSRVIYGSQVSIFVGLGAVVIGTTAATILGGVSGYFGGAIDALLQRVVDAFMSFPWLIILLAVMSILGPGLMNVILVLGVLFAFGSSRIVRGSVLSVKQNVYVEAARAMGCGHFRIMRVHILPNIMGPIIIVASLGLGGAILSEASLSFLGFGIPPPRPSWGAMLSTSGMDYMLRAPWMSIWPGVALSLAVFGFNMLGDAIRDLLDPRLRGAKGRFH